MKSPRGLLSGHKTYATAALGVVGAIVAFLTGEATGYQTFQTIFACISAATLRHGVATQNK
jgi:VIT1/CCC1 family predicted Fe2+/Mn2+ transporter